MISQNRYLLTSAFFLLIASSFVIHAYQGYAVATNRRYCDMQSTQRMLRSLGMVSRSADDSCIMKTKRDVSRLVVSFIENGRQSNLGDAIRDAVRDEDFNDQVGKRGKYCCSPLCDRFMHRMGKPKSKIIRCTGGTR